MERVRMPTWGPSQARVGPSRNTAPPPGDADPASCPERVCDRAEKLPRTPRVVGPYGGLPVTAQRTEMRASIGHEGTHIGHPFDPESQEKEPPTYRRGRKPVRESAETPHGKKRGSTAKGDGETD